MSILITRAKIFLALTLVAATIGLLSVSAQTAVNRPIYRIGEKLTYNVAFEHFENAAFAELYVVSAGKLGTRDAVELRFRLKTLNFTSAAFFLVDETTTSFVAAETGLPLYSRKDDLSTGLPKVFVRDSQTVPTTAHDLASLLYALRQASQGSSFELNAGDRSYAVISQVAGVERIKTDEGEFETTSFAVQSEYLTERGITDARVFISNDDARIPVVLKFTTAKGVMTATIAGIQLIAPETSPVPVPTPVPTPVSTPVPTPVTTPTPIPNNQPLSRDLPFVLGETLRYQISTGGKEIGRAVFRVESRTQFQEADSLLLSATIETALAGTAPFATGDFMRSRVNPETLVPQTTEYRLSVPGTPIVGNAIWDARTGAISFGQQKPTDAPIGTHSLLSLVYSMRAFNLKPSRDPNNPINDTRLAVYWDQKATVFSLRPAVPETLELGELKIPAQPVTITTDLPQFASATPKVWLSADESRIPLRIDIGPYRLELLNSAIDPPK